MKKKRLDRKITVFILTVISFVWGVAGIGYTHETDSLHFPSESLTLSVGEGEPVGTNVGDPVTAHSFSNLDRYTLSGEDAASFSIDASTGQLQTAVVLDHQKQQTHTVTVNAEEGYVDPLSDAVTGDVILYRSGVSIAVTINVPSGYEPQITTFEIENSGQKDLFTRTLAKPLVAIVKDQLGRGMAGVSVDFWLSEHPRENTSLLSSRARINGQSGVVTVTTNSEGRAEVQFRLGIFLGTYYVKTAPIDQNTRQTHLEQRFEMTAVENVENDIEGGNDDLSNADPDPGPPAVADALPGLSSQEVSQLAALLRYDTIIFNELHNGAVNTNDWLELRNVSGADLSLDGWQLTIRTGSGSVVIPLPTGTVIPAGEVVLLVNTEIATTDISVASVVAETFVLPQTDFALVLRSPTAFGDIAGNYFQAEGERPETAPTFAVDTAWYRTEPFVFGYRADAWAESRDGLGTPGSRHPSSAADLNNDGVVDILDLVLVASQFGSTGTVADLNNDGTVNIQDLVLVANALGDVAGAPAAEQSTAGLVNSWLRLARQHTSSVVETALPEGFSYERGILTLEQLARALMPERTALLANYPNPFNPETWIPYQLAKASEVTVTIYTSEGSVVQTLAFGHQAAGMYKSRSQAAYWDGKNAFGETVASGLYFYTLTAGEFTATRKMLILK